MFFVFRVPTIHMLQVTALIFVIAQLIPKIAVMEHPANVANDYSKLKRDHFKFQAVVRNNYKF